MPDDRAPQPAGPRSSRGPLRRARWGLLALAGALMAACALPATPIPITPLQIMSGQWPPPAPAVANNTRPYTVSGDTFAYPALGFSVNRASKNDWLFQPSNNGVSIVYRVSGDEPQPTLAVTLAALPANTNFQAVKEADKTQLLKSQNLIQIAAGTQHASDPLVQVTPVTVSALSGEAWDYQQQDAQSGILARSKRIYVLDGGIAAVIQAVASDKSFAAHQAEFDQMIASIVLPPQPGGAASAAPSTAP